VYCAFFKDAGTGFLWDCRKEYPKRRINPMVKEEKESERRKFLRKETFEVS